MNSLPCSVKTSFFFLALVDPALRDGEMLAVQALRTAQQLQREAFQHVLVHTARLARPSMVLQDEPGLGQQVSSSLGHDVGRVNPAIVLVHC